MASAIQHPQSQAPMMTHKRPREDDYEDEFDLGKSSTRPKVEVEPIGAPNAMQKLFGDPEKMLHLWLQGEAKPNPFAENAKDPMESFGKFIQSMLMQTQTDALSQLKNTMTQNQRFAATGLIGEVGEVESNKMTIAPGKRITETFTVPEEADAFFVEIKNAQNEVVYENVAYEPGAGMNQFEWAGTDNDGKEVPVGDYQLTISLLQKHVVDGSPPRFEHFEYARTLDSEEIHNKKTSLASIDREVQFSYEIPKGIPDLEHASIWIANSKGIPVHKGEIDVKTGERGVYSWNGLDREGVRVPEDVYTISVNFKDEKRKMIKTEEMATIRVSGKVQGIEMKDGAEEPSLITSRVKAPLSSVKRIINEKSL